MTLDTHVSVLRRHLAAAFLGFVVLSPLGCDQSADEVSIVAEPTCADCTVQMHLERTLRAPGVFMPFAQVVQDSAGTYYVAPVVQRGRIAVFDQDGALLRRLGSLGEGPGEFKEIRRLGIKGRDSLVVIHDFNRITIFSSEGEYARDYRLNTMSAFPARFVAQAGGDMLALRSGAMYGTRDYPARWYGPRGEPLTGFGSTADSEEGPSFASLTVSNEEVWFLEAQPLSLHRYTTAGELIERLHARSWYIPDDAELQGAGGIRERAYDLAQAGDTALWLLGWRKRPSRETDPPAPSGREIRARSLSVEEARQRNEWILDLIDPSGRRLIVRRSLDSSVPGGFLGPGRLYTYSESPDGEIEIEIWRLSVSNAP